MAVSLIEECHGAIHKGGARERIPSFFLSLLLLIGLRRKILRGPEKIVNPGRTGREKEKRAERERGLWDDELHGGNILRRDSFLMRGGMAMGGGMPMVGGMPTVGGMMVYTDAEWLWESTQNLTECLARFQRAPLRHDIPMHTNGRWYADGWWHYGSYRCAVAFGGNPKPHRMLSALSARSSLRQPSGWAVEY